MEPIHDFGKEAVEKEAIDLIKKKRMKKNILRTTLLLAVICTSLIFRTDIKNAVASGNGKAKKAKSKTGSQVTGMNQPSPGISVMKKWDLPKILTEISGLAYLGDERFACVQDESGTIYIYNTSTERIEKEIVFGPAGDYEGLALVGQVAWVLRADGRLFEVKDLTAEKPLVTEYATPLTVKHNTEGLCYDNVNNRLLVAIKDADPANADYKGIYAFDLTTKKMATEPLFRIDLRHEVFAGMESKKGKGGMMPSAIAIHPVTRDMYITEGRSPKLLITNSDGVIKKLYRLNSDEFAQPEGISFKPTGELFISNEGPKTAGNILRVENTTD